MGSGRSSSTLRSETRNVKRRRGGRQSSEVEGATEALREKPSPAVNARAAFAEDEPAEATSMQERSSPAAASSARRSSRMAAATGPGVASGAAVARPKRKVTRAMAELVKQQKAPPRKRPKRGGKASGAAAVSQAAAINERSIDKVLSLKSNTRRLASQERAAAITVVFSSVLTVEQSKFQTIVQDLGGRVSETSAEATHLVMNATSGLTRTEKLLVALSRGCTIVTTKWLDACRRAKEWVSPDGFLMSDAKAERDVSAQYRRYSACW
jgi:hypothetical protein